MFFCTVGSSGSSSCEQGKPRIEGPASLEFVPVIEAICAGDHLGMVPALLKRVVSEGAKGLLPSHQAGFRFSSG